MIYEGENGINGCHLAVLSVDVALPATSSLPTHPLPSHPVGMLRVLAKPVKNYLKWQETQLVIHSIVGELIDYKHLENRGNFHASFCSPSRVTIL